MNFKNKSKHSKIFPDENLEMSAFMQINQQSLAELLTFIDFADDKLTIGFVCINFAKDRNHLIEIIKNHESCQNIQFEVLTFKDPNLRFLRDAIVAELSKITIQGNKKLILIIIGLEQSIRMSGKYPPVLQDLNFVRDTFTTSVPHPILLFLPDYALTRLAKYAPDVWAWRKGVFEFKTVESTKDYAIERTLNSDRSLGSLELPQKQERIDLLQRLLMESPELPNRVNILKELGVAYRSIGEVEKAEDFLQEALRLTDDIKHLIPIKASILYEIGYLYSDLGKVDEAIALLQQSLKISEKIGDQQGKAASLHCLAIIYRQQGKLDDAIILHQQSLQISENIGEQEWKAASLHCLAIIYQEQAKLNNAIALHQQVLELDKKVGNQQGKAASLHHLGIIYQKQGKVDEAITLFQHSLHIKETIGDIRGKAMTLWWLGDIAQQQGDNNAALEYLQESFEILQRIKSPHAQGVKEMIDGIRGE